MFIEIQMKIIGFKEWGKRRIVLILLLFGLIFILGGIVIGAKLGGAEGKAFTEIFSDLGLLMILFAVIIKIYRWRKMVKENTPPKLKK